MSDPSDSRPVSHSRTEMIQLATPSDLNSLGNMLGGRVMHHMDLVAAIAAQRHAGHVCVTASVDRIDFIGPVRVGEVLVLKAAVNYAHRTSMEVGVLCMAENAKTGERRHTASAYFTFVALDSHFKPTTVPALTPVTPVERRRYDEAHERRAARLRERRTEPAGSDAEPTREDV